MDYGQNHSAGPIKPYANTTSKVSEYIRAASKTAGKEPTAPVAHKFVPGQEASTSPMVRRSRQFTQEKKPDAAATNVSKRNFSKAAAF